MTDLQILFSILIENLTKKLNAMKEIKKNQINDLMINVLQHSFPLRLCASLVLVLFGSAINAQNHKSETLSPHANITYTLNQIGKVTSYSSSDAQKVGYEVIAGSTDFKIHRKGLSFQLGTISSNSNIDSCKLSFSSGLECGSNDGTLIFAKIHHAFPTWWDNHVVYDTIKAGTKLDSIAISNNTSYNVSLNGIKQDIQNAIQSSEPYIGLAVYNKFENSTYGTSFTNISLQVFYTVPTPASPTNLNANSVTGSSLNLLWDASPGNVTGYKVYCNNNLYSTTSSTNILITGLCANTNYTFKVVAFNIYGDGDPSANVVIPTLSTTITGPTYVCDSNTEYTVNNIASAGSIFWETYRLTLLSSQGVNPCLVQPNGIGNGWVKATVTSQLCPTTVIYKSISVGYPEIFFITFTNPVGGEGYWCSSHYGNTFEPIVNFENLSYEARLLNWPSLTIFRTCPNAQPGQDPFGYVPAGFYVFELRASNNCGQSDWFSTEVEYVDCLEEESFSLLVYPNPTSGDLTLTIDNINPQLKSSNESEKVTCEFYHLYQSNPALVLQFESYKDPQRINVSNLKPGPYKLIVTIGEFKQSCSVILK